MRHGGRRIAVWALALSLGVGGLLLPGTSPSAAAAGASVAVSPEGAPSRPDLRRGSTCRGSGFVSKQNGFGGIYVLFGWVDGSWRPSKGGVSGRDYQYVADDANKPVGYQLFVHFPGDSTASSANGGELRLNGTWDATIVIPGATITVADQSGATKTIDCTTVQCGIITIGAHGVTEPANETFTPVRFAQAQTASRTSAAESGTAASSAAAASTAAASVSATPAPVAATVQPTPVATAGTVSWRVSDVLLLIAGCMVALSVLALAAGTGGYLAVKSLLIGVSPAARARYDGAQARRAARERSRQERRMARAEQRRQRRADRRTRRTTDERAGLPPAVAFLSGRDTGEAGRDPDPSRGDRGADA